MAGAKEKGRMRLSAAERKRQMQSAKDAEISGDASVCP